MRKMYIKYLLFAFVMFGFLSCQKETPTDQQGDVTFRFDGTIGADNVVFEAGVNDYILDASYTGGGANDLLLMSGEFSNKVNAAADMLSFKFYGYDSASNAGILQNVFNQTNYNSYSADSTIVTLGDYRLQFYTVGFGGNHTWDFGDGSTGIGDSVSHTYSANTTGNVPVTLNSFYPQPGCGDSVINTLNFNDLVNSKIGFSFSANQTFDNYVFTATGNTTAFNWDLGNGFTPTGPTATVNYTDSLPKTIQLAANIVSSTYYWRAKITPYTASCLSFFDYDILSTPTTISSIRLPYKTCIINYRKNGVTYSSYKGDNSNQSGRTVFTLNSASAYEKNPAGQPTIQLLGSVQTYLYNENNINDSIQINASNVKIAVAHP